MIGFGWLVKLFSSGLLDRALDTVDKRIDAENDRNRVKGEIIKAHLQTRPDFMRSGGFVLMLMFATPIAVWVMAVCVYSMLWCADCIYPQPWTIAALPPPLDEWAGWIVLSIFGVLGADRVLKK